jgi:hypothetical protein
LPEFFRVESAGLLVFSVDVCGVNIWKNTCGAENEKGEPRLSFFTSEIAEIALF